MPAPAPVLIGVASAPVPPVPQGAIEGALVAPVASPQVTVLPLGIVAEPKATPTPTLAAPVVALVQSVAEPALVPSIAAVPDLAKDPVPPAPMIIEIGRIDIRLARAAATNPPERKASPRPVVSLSEYLDTPRSPARR